MLKIGVHDRNVLRSGGQHAFDTGRGETTPADAFQDADPPVVGSQATDELRGPVGRIVVHENGFPFGSRQCLFQEGEQRRNILGSL